MKGRISKLWRHMKLKTLHAPLRVTPREPTEKVRRNQSLNWTDNLRAAFSHGLQQVWLPESGSKRGEDTMRSLQACPGGEHGLTTVWEKAVWNPFHVAQPPSLHCQLHKSEFSKIMHVHHTASPRQMLNWNEFFSSLLTSWESWQRESLSMN